MSRMLMDNFIKGSNKFTTAVGGDLDRSHLAISHNLSSSSPSCSVCVAVLLTFAGASVICVSIESLARRYI